MRRAKPAARPVACACWRSRKSTDAATAAELVRLGASDLGENRLEGLEQKAQALAAAGLAPRWHFVGHLQRNKMRRILEHTSVFHSIDRPSVLSALERLATDLGRRPEVFLQVRVAGGVGERSGVLPAELPELAEQAARSESIDLAGLMTMGPRPDGDANANQRRARATFDELVRLGRTLPATSFVGERCRFSMGMSGDLDAAIAAGADIVRIGRALVGTAESTQ